MTAKTSEPKRMTADEARVRHIVLRDRLIAAALEHVPFDGWSRKALAAGAADLGLGEADVLRAFQQPLQARKGLEANGMIQFVRGIYELSHQVRTLFPEFS